jgi:hypothetical protein
MALEPEWELCGEDWGACDLRHRASKARVQVKQSAARQSWHGEGVRPAKPRFSIAEKTGRWEGNVWIAEPGRNADVFVFCWHPITDTSADHRDPRQWLFYIVDAAALPARKSISLAAITGLTDPTSYEMLPAALGSYSAPAAQRS